MSKARQQRLIEIVRSSATGRLVERHRDSSGSIDGRHRNDSSATNDSWRIKKSKRAAAS